MPVGVRGFDAGSSTNVETVGWCSLPWSPFFFDEAAAVYGAGGGGISSGCAGSDGSGVGLLKLQWVLRPSGSVMKMVLEGKAVPCPLVPNSSTGSTKWPFTTSRGNDERSPLRP